MGAPSPGGLQGQFQGVGLLQGANTIPLIWGPHLRTARFFVEFYYKMNILYGFGKYNFFPWDQGASRVLRMLQTSYGIAGSGLGS